MQRFAVAAVVVALAAGPALADGPSEPRPSLVTGRLEGGSARLVAHFAIDVEAGAENETSITLPVGAVATGATAIVGGVSHRLGLLPAEDAMHAFDAVREGEFAPLRAWAIEFSGGFSHALSVVIATPRAARVTLVVELEAASCFYADARYVPLPESWVGALDHLTRAPAALEASIALECGNTAPYLAFPTSEVAALPADRGRFAVVAGRLPLSREHLARVELDLAGTLTDVPRDLYTAIVVDGSRSLSQQEADAQRQIVLAYLRAAPLGRVQIIAYARHARALLPGWTNATAASARADRELRVLEARNGSNLDAGLAEAAGWLARVDGTKRIVMFTDERIGDRLANLSTDELRAQIGDGTLVHVVAIDTGSGGLARDDTVKLDELAVATEGIGVRGRVDGTHAVDATLLARPIELDDVVLDAPGWKTIVPEQTACAIADITVLEEGRSCTWWGRGDASSGPVTISGKLWNHRVTRIVAPDRGQARTLARRLVGSLELDDALSAEVERASFAVSAAWSLFATWGGTGGYSGYERTGFGSGSMGSGSISDAFDTGTFIGHARLRVSRDLRSQFARGVAACHAGAARVEISIETTLQEIVDVNVKAAGASSAVRDCITDAVWDTMVAIPDAPEHATTTFAFDPSG